MANGGDGGGGGAPDGWRRVYDVFGYVGGAILAVMTAAVFTQVVLRYLGRVGIDGLEEVPRYLFIWLVMIGAASAMQRGEHTVLDYFVNRMGPRARALVIAVTNIVGIGLFLYLIKLSWVLVPNAQLQTSAGLNLPLGYVFVAVPIGSALIILPMARAAYRALRDGWPRPS
ncbi:MAG TPA: TRAP transporter small permease [Hyphomicrobiaceae bacterium]|jgi:TRAP-type C4-dicarboxylate transport system permease small subunit|nr:TRAP transporter small permease [Hyphomicrobiaceae bacterium]